MAGKYGLFQKADGGVWYTRKVIPKGARVVFGKTSFIASTGETDRRKAEDTAKRLQRVWTSEIKARASMVGPVATVEQAEAAITTWRVLECDRAAGVDRVEAQRREAEAFVRDVMAAPRGPDGEVSLGPFSVLIGQANPGPSSVIASDAVALAEGYFKAHPDASRSLELPHATGLLLGAYERASEDPDAFAAIEDFDGRLEAAVKAGGLAAALTPLVREKVRRTFAGAALVVEKYCEAERRRAAAILAAVRADPADVRPISSAPAYQARPDDVTLGEGMKRYKAERAANLGEADTEKDVGHIARALEELVGTDKPLRAITRDDCARIGELLRRMPANASKIYPGVPLVEAAERAAQDRAAAVAALEAKGEPVDPRMLRPKLMAPLTVGSYLNTLGAFFNWCVDRGLADGNPARGLGGPKTKRVKRRAFTKAELETVFAPLQDERARGSAKFWVPAILLFSGCRANEVCQLRTCDVKEHGGIPYFDLTLFDETGMRLDDKRLKTEASERCVPIHPELIRAGLLEFVAERRSAGADRLFPELKPRRGYYSDDLSKWWGRWCDRCGLSDPALTLHSHRHHFRDAGRDARVPAEVVDALGGWTTEGVGARYGDRVSVAKLAENLDHMRHMKLGAGFTFGAVSGSQDSAGRREAA